MERLETPSPSVCRWMGLGMERGDESEKKSGNER